MNTYTNDLNISKLVQFSQLACCTQYAQPLSISNLWSTTLKYKDYGIRMSLWQYLIQQLWQISKKAIIYISFFVGVKNKYNNSWIR